MSEQLPRDEVTLVDLLVVLLRYRRFIIGCTGLTLLVGLAVSFLLPVYRDRKSPDSPGYEAVMTCRVSPGVLEFMEKGDDSRYVLLALNDPEVILASLRDSGIENIDGISPDDSDKDTLLFTIRKRLAESGSIYSVQKQEENFRVSVFMKDPEEAKLFLYNLLTRSNLRMNDLLLPFARAEIYSYEKLASIEYPRAVIEEDLLETFRRYAAAVRLSGGEENALMAVEEPYVIMQTVNTSALRRSLIKKTIFAGLGVLCVTILFSFVLQWAYNVRHNPGAMEKIRRALKRD